MCVDGGGCLSCFQHMRFMVNIHRHNNKIGVKILDNVHFFSNFIKDVKICFCGFILIKRLSLEVITCLRFRVINQKDKLVFVQSRQTSSQLTPFLHIGQPLSNFQNLISDVNTHRCLESIFNRLDMPALNLSNLNNFTSVRLHSLLNRKTNKDFLVNRRVLKPKIRYLDRVTGGSGKSTV